MSKRINIYFSVERRQYIAYREDLDDSSFIGMGRTPLEALGDLVNSNQENFGVIILKEKIRKKEILKDNNVEQQEQ